MVLIIYILNDDFDGFIQEFMNGDIKENKRKLLYEALRLRRYKIAEFLLLNGIGLLHPEIATFLLFDSLPDNIIDMLREYEKFVLESPPMDFINEIRVLPLKERILLDSKFRDRCFRIRK